MIRRARRPEVVRRRAIEVSTIALDDVPVRRLLKRDRPHDRR